MALLLAENGMKVVQEKKLDVFFRNHHVGSFYADLIVDGKVLVELKSTTALLPEHKAQVIHYLRATRIQIALLINFGKPRLDYARIYPSGK